MANDEAFDQPLTANLIEPEEVPQHLTTEARSRTQMNWTHLPPPRTTRSMSRRDEAHVRVMAARVTGPKVHEALRSSEREYWVDAIYDEIQTVTVNTGCRRHRSQSALRNRPCDHATKEENEGRDHH